MAVVKGQSDVQKHKLRIAGSKFTQHIAKILYGADLIFPLLQMLFDQTGNRFVIFH